MRDCNRAQMFTVFGGAYVLENHAEETRHQTNKYSGAKWIAMAGILALGLTTATASKHAQVPENAWAKSPSKVLMVNGYAEALY